MNIMENDRPKLHDFAVLTFDCYGTLIDWETGIWDAFQPLIVANARCDIRRNQVLEAFGVNESRVESEFPTLAYPDVLSRVHCAVADQLDLETSPGLDLDFSQSLPLWPAFPDTADALRALKSRYKLVILSNVNRDGFSASNRKLGVEFDAVYTSEDIGSYKPDPANFDYLLAHLAADLDLRPAEVLHTAQSPYHDHAPAKAIGLNTTWIDRQRLSESGRWGATAWLDKVPQPDFVFHSLAEMAKAVTTEPGGRK